MPFLLDTSTCIAAMKNDPLVTQKMSTFSPRDLAISTITSYELYTGVSKCKDPSKERLKIDMILNVVAELPFDSLAARAAGQMRAILESQGQMIGPYDVLLAGHALATGMVLVTSNITEFRRVPGLQVDDWSTG